jgi:hypothetical protein
MEAYIDLKLSARVYLNWLENMDDLGKITSFWFQDTYRPFKFSQDSSQPSPRNQRCFSLLVI